MTTHDRRSTVGCALALTPALALILAACAAGAGDLGTVAPPPGTPAPSAISLPSATPAEPTTVRVYFLLGLGGEGYAGIVPVVRTITTSAVEAATLDQLFAGPSSTEFWVWGMHSAIPSGSSLLSLAGNLSEATVNVSREFASGGESSTIVTRYAQVVYTLTQRNPAAGSVRFQIDGVDAPAVLASGPVERPVTRADYRDQLPAIWVDTPAWNGSLSSGGEVSGLANVFEAQFRLQVLDASRYVLVDMSVMATCGTGCWGTFAVRPTYTVTAAQWGRLRVFEPSPKDGSPIHVIDYPVWLTP